MTPPRRPLPRPVSIGHAAIDTLVPVAGRGAVLRTAARTLVAGLGLLIAAACGSEPAAPPEPAALEPAGAQQRVGRAGETLAAPLEVTVTDARGRPFEGATVRWSTPDPDGALGPGTGVTDASGTATATWTLGGTVGTQRATATLSGVGSVEFTARVDAGPVARVVLDRAELSLGALGETATLSAGVEDAFGNAVPGSDVSWWSDDTGVAAVDGQGVVTATGPGITAVTAQSAEVSSQVRVEVVQRPATLTLAPAVVEMAPGDTLRLEASVADAGGAPIADAEIVWASDVPAVVDVDGTGLLSAGAEGVAAVTATAGEVTATVPVSVAFPDSVALPVGPAGGTVAMPDGGASLTIPAGALAEETLITMQVDDEISGDDIVAGTFYTFGPAGTQFAQEATLSVRWDPALLAEGDDPSSFRITKVLDDGTRVEEASSVDATARTVEGPVRSFSTVGVTRGRGAPSPLLTTRYLQNRSIEVTINFPIATDRVVYVEWAERTGTLAPPVDADFALLRIVGSSAPTFTLPVGPQAAFYWFRARYAGASWRGPLSEPQRVTVFGLEVPAQPTGFTAEVDGGFVALRWDIDPVASNYRLDRAPLQNLGDWTFVDDTGFNPPFPIRDRGVEPETAYRYRLTPRNQQGTGPAAFADVTTAAAGSGECAAYTLDLTSPFGPLAQGEGAGTGIRVTPIGGFTGIVSFTIEGDMSAFDYIEWNPSIVVPDAIGGFMYVQTAVAQPPGDYDLTVRATSGPALCTLDFTVQVVGGQ